MVEFDIYEWVPQYIGYRNLSIAVDPNWNAAADAVLKSLP